MTISVSPLFASFLRRTSLYELPKFINVMHGRMSVVEQQPHAIEQIADCW